MLPHPPFPFTTIPTTPQPPPLITPHLSLPGGMRRVGCWFWRDPPGRHGLDASPDPFLRKEPPVISDVEALSRHSLETSVPSSATPPIPSHHAEPIPREPIPVPPRTLRDRPVPSAHDHETDPAPPRQPHEYPVSSFITNVSSDPMAAPGHQDLRVAPPTAPPGHAHHAISTISAQLIALTYPVTQPPVYGTYLDAFLVRVPGH